MLKKKQTKKTMIFCNLKKAPLVVITQVFQWKIDVGTNKNMCYDIIMISNNRMLFLVMWILSNS